MSSYHNYVDVNRLNLTPLSGVAERQKEKERGYTWGAEREMIRTEGSEEKESTGE